jgi:N-acetyl-1-D-myo-inositol-2-amino-2-deoxy-alpha-D-glucopyranoside deacetylase
MTPGHRLLLVHAHPDDECINQGATMAKYVAEGRHITLVTCTAGERGEVLVPELDHLAWDRDNALGEHRRGELADAMAILGVTDYRFLGGFGTYSDSGMQWHPDGHAVAGEDAPKNAFWHADLTEAANHLVAVIREVRPQVLVTYDEFGGYGHPDHIQAHRVAMYAAQLAAVPSYRLDLGPAWEITKIYWGAIAEKRMRDGLRALREAGDTTSFAGMDPDGPLPHFVVGDEHLSTIVEAGEYAGQKMSALRAHRTQVTEDSAFFALTKNLGDEVMGEEHFRIVKGTPVRLEGRDVEADLFAGIDTSA